MSNYTVADGELPPWLADDSGDLPDYLLEGGGSGQVAAGSRTPDARNRYAIPEPGATASTGSDSPTSQNQPNLADANPEPGSAEDTIVENDPAAPAPSDPLLTAATASATSSPATASASSPRTKETSSRTISKRQLASRKTVKKPKKLKEPTWVTYKVRPGDSLSLIAKRSNTTVAQIRRDSGISGHIIHPGQEIKVRYTPNSKLKTKNAATNKQGTGKTTRHTVARGETIASIAKRNGLGYEQILKANGMTAAEAAKIRPGRKLIIPAKSSASSQKSSSSSKKSKTSSKKRSRKRR